MKTGWEVRPLGEVAQVSKTKGGLRPLPYVGLEDISAGGTGIFTGSAKSQMDKSTTFEFSREHLLYGRLRPYLNKVLLPDFEGHCSSEIFPILPTSRLDRRFLFYWITRAHTVESIDATCTGARMPRANLSEILSFPIPLPPLEEQQRIVAVLDEAFEGLARARAHVEANLQNARDLFIQELKCTFLPGQEGWKKGKIEDLCTIRSGTTVPKSQERPVGDVPYVKVADMNLAENVGGILTSSRFLSMGDVPHRNIIPTGATIFPKRGGAIMTNKKRKVLVDICADLNVMGVIPGKEIDEDFLYFFFLSIDMRVIGSGSAIPQINNYDINPLEFYYPPHSVEQSNVAETLQILRDQSFKLTEHYQAKIQDLDNLRQSLLQKAFAGELT